MSTTHIVIPPFVDSVPSDAPVAPAPRVLASLVNDSVTPPRPLIHLGLIDSDLAAGQATTPTDAVGVCHPGSVHWHSVGALNLNTDGVERVLLAGLSALAMRHVRAAQVQIGDAVMVFGADPWSLLLLQWARLQGASPLAFACRGRQSLCGDASGFGIDAVFADPTPGDLARAIKMTHRGEGFAAVLDAIASEQSVSWALPALRDGGRYVLSGLDAQQQVSLNAYTDLHRRDLEILSSSALSGPDTDFADRVRFSLHLAGTGRLQLEGVVGEACGWRLLSSDGERQEC